MSEITRDYREANYELWQSYIRYLTARGFSPNTVKSYSVVIERYVDCLGAKSACQAERADLYEYMGRLLNMGTGARSMCQRVDALKSFYKFLVLTGFVANNPTTHVSSVRRVPKRLPRVLLIEEVEKLIAAARNPVERAIVETLYATGVRVSELVNIRLEHIDLAEHRILVKEGKGRKDRIVPYGQYAARAINEYLAWRPSKDGYLFESPARDGHIRRQGDSWLCCFYTRSGKARRAVIGKLSDLPTMNDARQAWNRLAASFPEGPHHPSKGKPQGPYTRGGIARMLKTLGHLAGIGNVYPHALRRAIACHMLASGGDLRAIQELLGHRNLTTTQIYTTLTNEQVHAIYMKSHPHAKGQDNEQAS